MNILIHVNENELSPKGGISGYVYNIKAQRDKLKDKDILFLSDSQRNASLLNRIIAKMKFPKSNFARYYYQAFQNQNHKNSINKYDFVHFHSTMDLFANKKMLDEFKGKIILTSHSPKAMHREIVEDVVNITEYKNYKIFFDSLEIFDKYAFERADYIIFPCSGAEEPYYHSWSGYAELREESKIRYVPTGILPVVCKKSRQEIRGELNIPEDAIALSFVGRHNEVKGYDILQDIFLELENFYVICCGNIGTIQPPKSERWIEVGWTTDPYSYVGASDIYMLPNRETYFDIAMLQALSIGKCSVISNTGGNKEFLNTPGVKLYDSIKEAVKYIKEFATMSVDERARLESLQRKEFEEKYTIEVFYNKYKETIKELLEGKNNGK